MYDISKANHKTQILHVLMKPLETVEAKFSIGRRLKNVKFVDVLKLALNFTYLPLS